MTIWPSLDAAQDGLLRRALENCDPETRAAADGALSTGGTITFHIDPSHIELSNAELHVVGLINSGKDALLASDDRAALEFWRRSIVAKVYGAVARITITAQPKREPAPINIAISPRIPITIIQEPPAPTHKTTRVTAHDAKGRIKAFETTEEIDQWPRTSTRRRNGSAQLNFSTKVRN